MLVSFSCVQKKDFTDALISECASLFSSHYGVWGPQGPKPSQRVTLSAARLKAQCLFADSCAAFLAHDASSASSSVVGHLFFQVFDFQGKKAMWVTQLVVHSDWRGKAIAKQLFSKAFGSVPDAIAWGLVSSHPYAVRALETATQRFCVPSLMERHVTELMRNCGVPYISDSPYTVNATESNLNTKFFVDHTEVLGILKLTPDWWLGQLEDGHEFLAFTFKEQQTKYELVHQSQSSSSSGESEEGHISKKVKAAPAQGVRRTSQD